MVTDIKRFMELTTFMVHSGDMEFKVTVLGTESTAVLLGILPTGKFDEQEFIFKNYRVIAEKVIYPCILEPKIPIERLTVGHVLDIFPTVFDASFGNRAEVKMVDTEKEERGERFPE